MTGMNGHGQNGPDGYPINALRESWHSIDALSRNLSERIEAHCVETGEQFDKMLLIPRGSYAVGNVVSRELGFEAPEILHACITTYKRGKTTRSEKFRIGQMPTPE